MFEKQTDNFLLAGSCVIEKKKMILGRHKGASDKTENHILTT